MKILRFLVLLLVSLSPAVTAQEINPGLTFADGQRLTAAQLGQLVSQATIQPAFYTDKIAQTNIGTSDLLLIYSPSSGTFHKVTGSQGIYANTAIIANQVPYVNLLNTNYFLLGYDGTNATLFQFNLTNLLWTAAPLIQVQALNFSNTLSSYGLVAPLQITNNLEFFVWDTNGIPQALAITNLIKSLAPTLGTNLNLPYAYQQMFAPWTVYNTNAVTNAWGNVEFPITNLFIGSNPAPTLTNTDTLPINSLLQGSNSVVNLDALYEYFTNRNALPAYTQARANFSGIPVFYSITNANTTFGLLSSSNNGAWASSAPAPALATPYAINFVTNGPAANFYFSGANSNIVYYIVPTQTNGNWFKVYTNYNQAVHQTNWVNITSTGTGQQRMLYLTNYTSFNADAIQTSAGQNVNQSEYLICFRTPSPTPFYYLTGTSIADANHVNNTVTVNIDAINTVTTNQVQVIVNEGVINYVSPLIHVLISPQ